MSLDDHQMKQMKLIIRVVRVIRWQQNKPQNTQKYAEIYNGSREGTRKKVFVSFRVVCG